jgi:hypothetical protein
MKLLIITIIEVIYVYFMLNFFKTRFSIHHPLEYMLMNKLPDFFKHPISEYDYSNKICPFGHFSSNILVLYLIFRYFIVSRTQYKIKNTNIIILLITVILSLLNMNAFVYLIPYFVLELYVQSSIL